MHVGNETDPFDVELWDTGGDLGPVGEEVDYVSHADAVFILFDVSDKATLNKAGTWAMEIAEKKTREAVKVFLVGCKCDTPEVARAVFHNEGGEMYLIDKYSCKLTFNYGHKKLVSQYFLTFDTFLVL